MGGDCEASVAVGGEALRDWLRHRTGWSGGGQFGVSPFDPLVLTVIEIAAPAKGDAWTGIAASTGHARAVARVLLHPEEGDRLQGAKSWWPPRRIRAGRRYSYAPPP
jgi:hypothetical protein